MGSGGAGLVFFFGGEGGVDVEEAVGEAHFDEAVAGVHADEVLADEGDEDVAIFAALDAGLRRAADDEELGAEGGAAIEIDDGADGEGAVVEVDELAADEVAGVDGAGGEGGAFLRGDGDGVAADGFGFVDGVDALELEDDAAAEEPEVLEADGAGAGADALGGDEVELFSLVEALGEVGQDFGDELAAAAVGTDEGGEQRPWGRGRAGGRGRGFGRGVGGRSRSGVGACTEWTGGIHS